MKTKIPFILVTLALLASVLQAAAQGTAFSYQGRLVSGGAPANGTYDFQFTLYNSSAGGTALAGPQTISAVSVNSGVFTVMLDFGAGVFDGGPRWLEIAARPAGGGGFSTLPRQPITATPYAIFAASASNVISGSIVTSLNGLKDAVTLAAGANVTITPSGNTLTIASTGGGGDSVWSLTGSNAFYNAGSVGIGTDTPQSKLEIVGQNALRLRGFQPFLTLYDASVGNARGRIQSVNGELGFFTESYLSGANSSALLKLANNGNVGIGAVNPATKLTVQTGGLPFASYGIEHTDGNVRLSTYLSTSGGWLGTRTSHPLFFYVNDGSASMTIDTAQNVGIGTTTPTTKLDVAGDVKGTRLILRADPLASANAAVLCDDPNVQNFVPFNTANNRPLNILVRDATVRVLTITGGADVAEPFAMSHEGISPGSVVVIDEESPGSLKLSTRAYNTRVAGVVSGANGIKPGISLRQEGALEGGENVALSGRVYVRADASHGGIKPGDLLTTSDTPGHAMKVADHAKAQGAILGKAMSGLKEGKGLVLVLVTLQ